MRSGCFRCVSQLFVVVLIMGYFARRYVEVIIRLRGIMSKGYRQLNSVRNKRIKDISSVTLFFFLRLLPITYCSISALQYDMGQIPKATLHEITALVYPIPASHVLVAALVPDLTSCHIGFYHLPSASRN